MSSTMSLKDIPEDQLANTLEIAYEDLRFVMARIIALRRRLNPIESEMNALMGALNDLKWHTDEVFAQSASAWD